MTSRFKFHPIKCTSAWVWVSKFVPDLEREVKMRLLDLNNVCAKCGKLSKCQASLLLKVNKRITDMNYHDFHKKGRKK